mgnify:CR=1 FL=1
MTLPVTLGRMRARGTSRMILRSSARNSEIFAWPTAQMVVVGAEGAVDICRKHELKRAEESGKDVAALRAHYIEEYKEEFFNPYKAAEYGKFEDVIEPAESRRVIIRTLELFQNKQVVLPAKKHGNMPV